MEEGAEGVAHHGSSEVAPQKMFGVKSRILMHFRCAPVTDYCRIRSNLDPPPLNTGVI